MADRTTIKLGAKEFEISPFTVRQSRDLRVGEAKLPKDDGAGGWNNIYNLSMLSIAVAIREKHPEITEEQLWELDASEDEMTKARHDILIHCGFRAAEPTIAELRATVAAKKIELEDLEKTLAARESKAKETGEG